MLLQNLLHTIFFSIPAVKSCTFQEKCFYGKPVIIPLHRKIFGNENCAGLDFQTQKTLGNRLSLLLQFSPLIAVLRFLVRAGIFESCGGRGRGGGGVTSNVMIISLQRAQGPFRLEISARDSRLMRRANISLSSEMRKLALDFGTKRDV